MPEPKADSFTLEDNIATQNLDQECLNRKQTAFEAMRSWANQLGAQKDCSCDPPCWLLERENQGELFRSVALLPRKYDESGQGDDQIGTVHLLLTGANSREADCEPCLEIAFDPDSHTWRIAGAKSARPMISGELTVRLERFLNSGSIQALPEGEDVTHVPL